MTLTVLVGLRGDIPDAMSSPDRSASVLVGSHSALVAPRVGTPARRAFDSLLSGPVESAHLDALAGDSGHVELARWLRWRDLAVQRGLVDFRLVTADELAFAVFRPVRLNAPDLGHTSQEPARRMRLSRFASLRTTRQGLVLDSPLASMSVELSAAAGAVVVRFGSAASAAEECTGQSTLVGALLQAGLLVEVDEHGTAQEDVDPVLSQWEPHDLQLHVRTRTLRGDSTRGGTFRFAGTRPAPSPLQHPPGPSRVALPVPDFDRILTEDAPLARVMESRVSRRVLGPMNLGQLGEFLYRTVRVRRDIAPDAGPRGYARLDRPHPSAGGMGELITYLALDGCAGVENGLYRYDPREHALELVAEAGPAVTALLEDARGASGADSLAPALVILASDFARLSWKYEGIAYALTLKNVGVVYQSMQLVATAMGLGSCALGGGDSEAFARAAGTDPLGEASVGELILGS